MTEDVHERAAWLLDAERVEGLTNEDRAWLENHLSDCERCQARERVTELAVRSLRSLSVKVRPGLVSAAQLRVRLRARELREQQARLRALWISCGLSWILGAVSAPLLWRGFSWVGHRMALPEVVWVSAFALWWITPAALAGAIVAWGRLRASNGYADREMLRR